MSKIRTFIAICLRPSAVMVLTAGVVVAAFLTWLVLVTPQAMHAALSTYPGFAKLGDRTFLFHLLTELRETPPGGEVRVAVMGASTARESIWSPEAFAQRLSAGLGKPVSAAVLTSAGQRLLFSWSLVEQTVCNGFDVALVAVNMGLFTKDSGKNPARYIGYHSASVDAFLGESQRKSGLFLRDNTPFVMGTLYLAAHVPLYSLTGVSRMISRKDSSKRHRFLGKPKKPESVVMKKLQRPANKYSRNYPKHAAANFTLLDGMMETAKKCGGEIILIDTPRHPWLLERPAFKNYQDVFHTHHVALLAFAREHGLALIDPNELVAYTPADMNDGGHLRLETTIRATTDAIADAVAKHLVGGTNGREVSVVQ